MYVSKMIPNRALFFALACLLTLGCSKKDDTSASKSEPKAAKTPSTTAPSEVPKPAVETGEKGTEKPAPPTSAADKVVEEPAAPTEPPKKAPAEPTTPTEPANAKGDPTVKPTVAATVPTSKFPTPTICMRGCNKAQMCGLSKGSVVDCHQKCLDAFKADVSNPEALQKMRVYIARGECANESCAGFTTCAQSRLLGEAAVKSAPVVELGQASDMCQTLCTKEQTCTPEVFAQRRGGMPNCMTACKTAMTTPGNAAAVSRALLNRAHKCSEKPCSEFAACRHPASAPAGR